MFIPDESPEHVLVTRAASEHLRALASDGHPVALLLTDEGAQVLDGPDAVPAGSLRLGSLRGDVLVAGAADARTAWWRTRALVGLNAEPVPSLALDLSELSEKELFAALSSGPLPRF